MEEIVESHMWAGRERLCFHFREDNEENIKRLCVFLKKLLISDRNSISWLPPVENVDISTFKISSIFSPLVPHLRYNYFYTDKVESSYLVWY